MYEVTGTQAYLDAFENWYGTNGKTLASGSNFKDDAIVSMPGFAGSTYAAANFGGSSSSDTSHGAEIIKLIYEGWIHGRISNNLMLGFYNNWNVVQFPNTIGDRPYYWMNRTGGNIELPGRANPYAVLGDYDPSMHTRMENQYSSSTNKGYEGMELFGIMAFNRAKQDGTVFYR